MRKINDSILEINYLKSNQSVEYPILKLYRCLYRIAIKIIQISWKISLRVYKTVNVYQIANFSTFLCIYEKVEGTKIYV